MMLTIVPIHLPLCGLLCSRDGEHALTLGFWDWNALAVLLIAALLTIPITIAEKMLVNASTCVEWTQTYVSDTDIKCNYSGVEWRHGPVSGQAYMSPHSSSGSHSPWSGHSFSSHWLCTQNVPPNCEGRSTYWKRTYKHNPNNHITYTELSTKTMDLYTVTS